MRHLLTKPCVPGGRTFKMTVVCDSHNEGFYVFENLLELSSYSFDLSEKLLTPRNLLALDRRMTCPYYMVNNRKLNKLVMFGSKEAMMATLHGDMQRFITSLSY